MRRALAAFVLVLACTRASAQDAAVEPIRLSLKDAIRGALTSSLGMLTARSRVESARGEMLTERADVLPDVRARLSAQRQIINLEAYGFPPPAGESPLVGPFGVADARLVVGVPLIDLEQRREARAARADLAAERADEEDVRDVTVLLAANAYLQALAQDARIEAARAESELASAQLTKAQDLRGSGLVAGVDVVRASVQEAASRQRLLVARNDREQALLALARLVGLPMDRPIELTDRMPYAAVADVPLQEALRMAADSRGDLKRAQARVSAAEARVGAARAERLPTLRMAGDAGAIGPHLDDLGTTWTIGAAVSVPIFEGGRVKGDRVQADAELALRRAELADLRRGAEAQVRSAVLDVAAAAERLKVSEGERDLARTLLEQARDRFGAGVADSIEVAQAHDALASADERWIASLLAFNVAKASLARAMGVGEEAASRILGLEDDH